MKHPEKWAAIVPVSGGIGKPQTGTAKDTGIKDKIQSVTHSANTILVVSREPSLIQPEA